MKEPTRAPFFACLYPGLCDVARALGYALTIHGTVTNDLDLVAIPWTDEAVSAEDLMHALMKHIGALDYHGLLKRDCGSWATDQQIDQMVAGERERIAEPRGPFDCALKAHGRKAWNLYMDAGAKVDLSVMPRSMRPQNHQQRVVAEKSELDEKLTKLNAFIGGTVFEALDPSEQLRLRRQCAAMSDYSDILGERIAAFSGPLDTNACSCE